MDITRLHVARRLGWLAAILLPAAAGWAAETPIDRMEASTVRIVERHGQAVGTGSGFVVGDGSYVVTNHHVVEGAEELLVLGKNLKIHMDRVVADDPVNDLAIIHLTENSGRPAVELRLHSGVKKTETVLAAGFPGAADDQGTMEDFLEVKFTKGIISAFVKSKEGTLLYQIDAAINPGNSGGPLFDECGSVIGIDAMKSLREATVVGPDGQPTQERLPYGEGVAWAIQSDQLLSVMRAAGIQPQLASGACVVSASGPADSNTADAGAARVPSMGSSNRLLIGAGATLLLVMVGFVAIARWRSTRGGYAMAGAGQAGQNLQNRVLNRMEIPGPKPDLRLRGVSGVHAGQEFPVSTNPITLGRDPHMSQIVFDAHDSVVSKRHCTVRVDRVSGGLIVEDCGSTNGTFLDNGERLRTGEPRLVPPYGSFYLGDRSHVFQVKA
jgi:S1-C subfamily serine protease